MKHSSNSRWLLTTLLTSAALAACAHDDARRIEAASGSLIESKPASKADSNAAIAQIGVEPGPVQRSEAHGALLLRSQGDVQLRRLGEETFAPVKGDDLLYFGDQLRTGDAASVSVVFPDESVAELAELSTLAIGSRTASPDPASAAAVLSGVARFSVSPRAPGEGPFLVFSPSGLVATKGTVFAVGVAADGQARVGVESGAVEVAGAAALDAPQALEANTALTLSASGQLGVASAWSEDDWGRWRDEADAKLDVAATAELHATAMAELARELDTSYQVLAKLGAEVASFEATAAAQASHEDSAGYQAALPEAAVAIDASFLAGLRLEYLTDAYLAHAVLASELYVRHPKLVVWTPLAPHVEAAVLWPKRLDLTASAYLEPLRVQYYLHHPRGRAHARWVGVAVPSFYASVIPPEVPAADVQTKLKLKAFTPPAVKFTATARPVWIAAPSANWHSKLHAKAAAPRGKVAFWVRPPQLKSRVIVGTNVEGRITPAFAVRAPAPRGQLKGQWDASFGQKLKITPPNLQAAASARAKWKAEVDAPELKAGLHAGHEAPELDSKLKGKVALPKLQAHGKAGGNLKAKVNAGREESKASAKLQVKAPQVKAPKLKLNAKASASFRLGN